MSTSDLYVLNQKSTTHLAEFKNGWGSGPRCWDHLGAKYLNIESTMLRMSDTKRVWALTKDPRLERHERIAMMMTFDRAYVALKDLNEAADACEQFGRECENGHSVNHWSDFAAPLREVAQQRPSRHARGVVLNCTSVSDCWGSPSDDWLQNAWSIFEDGCLA